MRRAKGIYHVTYTLSATLNYESVLRAIFEEFVRVLPFDVGMVLLIEPGTNMLYVSGSYGLSKEELDHRIARRGQLGRRRPPAARRSSSTMSSTERRCDRRWPRLAEFQPLRMFSPLRSRFPELYGVVVRSGRRRPSIMRTNWN